MHSLFNLRHILLMTTAGAVLLSAADAALAGGFAIREQSASSQGASFAGNAAGGDLSSMFWNPAAVVVRPGLNNESHYSYIMGSSDWTAQPGTAAPLLALGTQSGDIGQNALVGSDYFNYQLSPKLFLGVSLNAPFGLSTKAEGLWAGSPQATTSKLTSYNLTPTVGYVVAPGLSIGVGLQIEDMHAILKSSPFVLTKLGAAAFTNPVVNDASDIGIGFTAGVLWQPHAATTIGVGFRSSVSHSLEGTAFIDGTTPPGGPLAGSSAAIRADLDTPEVVTLSLRQKLSPQFTGLLTGEWTNWSRLNSLNIVCRTVGTNALNPGCPAVGSSLQNLALNWHDGWFIAGGLEYQHAPNLILRTGIAWEQSPIQNPTERLLSLPDSDRFWVSVGATYKYNEANSFDFAYSHVFFDDASIDRSFQGLRLLANSSADADIVSVSWKSKLDLSAIAAPLK